MDANMGDWHTILGHHPIYGIRLTYRSTGTYSGSIPIDVFACDPVESRPVTWNSQPSRGPQFIDSASGKAGIANDRIESTDSALCVEALRSLPEGGGYQNHVNFLLEVSTPLPSGASYGIPEYLQTGDGTIDNILIQIEYDPDAVVTPKKVSVISGPTSGWLNRIAAQEISYELTVDTGDRLSLEPFVPSNASIHWRADTGGGYGGWQTTLFQSAESPLTIPAELFPAGSVQYYIEVTTDQGVTVNSRGPAPFYRPFTVSTLDTVAVATGISPADSVVDGTKDTEFRWNVSNESGSVQTSSQLQYKPAAAAEWNDPITVDGAITAYTIPENTFFAGPWVWRVRAANADGTFGEWSSPINFVVIAASAAPIVACNSKPFATVTWQVSGQQAYRVTVDGKVYGPYFGTEKQFAVPDYLPDGEHTVSVEVQNSYGLWSAPGAVSFSTENVPGEPVTLHADLFRDAELQWETQDSVDDYLIYRDDVQIGHSSAPYFTDRVVLGRHSWQIINRLPGGYYTASNAVSGRLETDCISIALLSGGDWLELKKSCNPTRQETYSLSQVVSLTHFAGQEYPEAEVSPYKTLQGSFDVSWPKWEEEQAAAFEAMIGKPIIFKAPSGETMVGILAAIQKNPVNFFKAYTATIQRINWRDFVDADN